MRRHLPCLPAPPLKAKSHFIENMTSLTQLCCTISARCPLNAGVLEARSGEVIEVRMRRCDKTLHSQASRVSQQAGWLFWTHNLSPKKSERSENIPSPSKSSILLHSHALRSNGRPKTDDVVDSGHLTWLQMPSTFRVDFNCYFDI